MLTVVLFVVKTIVGTVISMTVFAAVLWALAVYYFGL